LLIVKFHVIQNIHSTSETIAGKINQAIFLLKEMYSVEKGNKRNKTKHQSKRYKEHGGRGIKPISFAVGKRKT